MGGFLGVAAFVEAIGETTQLIQTWHYNERQEKLQKLSYELCYQAVRLDVLESIREEMRDQVKIAMAGLNNLMLVSSLMFTMGFGFIVEGLFPPKEAEDLPIWDFGVLGFNLHPLDIYSFLCGMCLACPFWSIMLQLRMRYEADNLHAEHHMAFKQQLVNVLSKRQIEDPGSLAQDQYVMEPGSVPQPQHEIHRPLATNKCHVRKTLNGKCAKRARASVDKAVSYLPRQYKRKVLNYVGPLQDSIERLAQHIGPYSLPEEPASIEREQVLRWAEHEHLRGLNSYRWYKFMSTCLLILAMLCFLFNCSVLTGMYMVVHFPNTPNMWKIYSGTTASFATIAFVFALAHIFQFFKFTNGAPEWRELTRGGSVAAIQRSRTGFSQATSSESPEERQKFEIRVRDTAGGHDSFRRVALSCHPREMALEDLKRRIAQKFRRPQAPGARAPRAQVVLTVTCLLRLSDSLELHDDEDAQCLANADRLEVTFAG
eukprot:TRINITY_DN55610_c0_g1_i1.p1 TRINITY_DN55610_c0_g1~~TRINITY_DN55610_c0_g1_i1.p1  ORF type:complete len:485 (+),score=81.23 TRINITY_DN55610_c0_g1_i1:92-1546(+)